MATIIYAKERGTYWYVLSDGKWRTQVEETTEGAVRRDWESKDGKNKGTKWELIAEAITGKIINLSVYEGDYGKNIQILLAGDGGDAENGVIISLSASSPFGEDFLKKLPNLDTEKEVRFVPYSFEDDNKKTKRGITLYQGEGFKDKITGAYYEKDEKTGKGKTIGGYPEVKEKDAKKWDSDNWKLFYLTARKFLLEELVKHPLYEKISFAPQQTGAVEYPEEDSKNAGGGVF